MQQNPGGGDWHEVASFESLSYDASTFELKLKKTGGQSYNIWLLIGGVNISDFTVSTSGPLTNTYKGIGDFPFPNV